MKVNQPQNIDDIQSQKIKLTSNTNLHQVQQRDQKPQTDYKPIYRNAIFITAISCLIVVIIVSSFIKINRSYQNGNTQQHQQSQNRDQIVLDRNTDNKLEVVDNETETMNKQITVQTAKLQDISSFITPIDQIANTYLRHQSQNDEIKKKNLQLYLQKIVKEISRPSKYAYIQTLKSYKQLPFCILIDKIQNNYQKIIESIHSQNYSNYHIVRYQSAEQSLKQQIHMSNHSYKQISYLIKAYCKPKSIILFPKSALNLQALKSLNSYYQQKTIWMTFIRQGSRIQVFSLYDRLYDLIQLNDFTYKNRLHLLGKQKQHEILALLQMCPTHSLEYKQSQLYNQTTIQVKGVMQQNFKQSQFDIRNRTKYQKLFSMRQDYQIDVKTIQKYYNQIQKIRMIPLNMDKFQMIFMPQNHTIFELQINQLYQSHQGHQFIQQLPMCITVVSHNNIQNGRYAKVMDSIYLQNYTNYKIVFIDDMSTDGTMLATMQYMDQIGFPKNKIHYIQNLQQNFATYNIINAAFNYCRKDDIMVLLDGDDQFMGRQVLKVFNSQYQKKKAWIIYSNALKNQFRNSTSIPYTKIQQIHQANRRKRFHMIVHLQTWSVQLIRHMLLEDHKTNNGEWLHGVYDDAFQYPLLEMAGPQKSVRLNDYNYFWNRGYGDTDNTPPKVQWIQRRYYPQLKSLESNYTNFDVTFELLSDRQKKYIQITSFDLAKSYSFYISQSKKNFQRQKQVNCSIYIQGNNSLCVNLNKYLQPVKYYSFNQPSFQNQFNFEDSKLQRIKSKAYLIGNLEAHTQQQQKAFFMYNYRQQPDNQDYKILEYNQLALRYGIDKQQTQQQSTICVIAYSRNSYYDLPTHFRSIVSQNYSNYKYILINDASIDKTSQEIERLKHKYSFMQQRIIHVKNQKQKYVYQSKKQAIKKYCNEADLILEIDLTMRVLGHQFFKLINKIFKNEDIWTAFFNTLRIGDYSIISQWVQIRQDIKYSQFRTGGLYFSKHARAYKVQIFSKIAQSDFVDSRGETLKYLNDQLIDYALLELTCPKHCKQISQFNVLYNQTLQIYYRDNKLIRQAKIMTKSLKPYQPMKQISDIPSRGFKNESLRQQLQQISSQKTKPIPSKNQQISQTCIFSISESPNQVHAIYQSINSSKIPFKMINLANNQNLAYFSHLENYRYINIEEHKQKLIVQIIAMFCPKNSVILFLQSPINNQTTIKLLQNFKQTNLQMVYSQSTDTNSYSIKALRQSSLKQIDLTSINNQNEAIQVFKKFKVALKSKYIGNFDSLIQDALYVPTNQNSKSIYQRY